MQPAFFCGGDQLFGLREVHDVHLVIADVVFERGGQFRPFGVRHGDEILDPHRVEHLPAETLRGNAGADALARGIDRRRRTSGATADHQHLEGILGIDRSGCLGIGVAVEAGSDLLQRLLARQPHMAILEDRRHGHHATLVDFRLIRTTLDQRGAESGVAQRDQRQRLHHIGAVVAGEREIHFECMGSGQSVDLGQGFVRHLGRMATGPQQRQHQRGELMPQRQAGKAHAIMRCGGGADGEAGLAAVRAVETDRNLVGQGGDFAQQFAGLRGFRILAKAGDQSDRLAQQGEILLQLGGQGGVEHGNDPSDGSYEGHAPRAPLNVSRRKGGFGRNLADEIAAA